MTHFSSRRLSLLLSGSTTVLSRVETRPGVGGGKLGATQRFSKDDCRRRVRPPASSRLTHNSYYTLSHSHTLASITFTHSHKKVWTTTSGALMQNGDVHLTIIIRGSESLEVWYHRGGVPISAFLPLFPIISTSHVYLSLLVVESLVWSM